MTKISQLSSIGDSLAIGDQFLIRDIDDAGSPNKSVTVSGITRALADGDATAPALAFAADKNTGIYRAGTDSLAVATNGTGRLFVDATGAVEVIRNNNVSVECLTLTNQATSGAANASFQNFKTFTGSSVAYAAAIGATASTWSYGNSQPNSFIIQGYGSGGVGIRAANAPIIFSNGNADPHFSLERAQLDSSGRLLVGTSSSSVNTSLVLNGSSDGASNPGIAYLQRNEATPGSGSALGQIYFANNAGNAAALVTAARDGGTWTSGSSHPGRLVFSTTSDSASSPTERLRITSAGVLQVADAGNITVGTTTGTKIGTATTQKIGFYNATPVVQPAAVADATDAASGLARLNDLLARLRTLGIIAT